MKFGTHKSVLAPFQIKFNNNFSDDLLDTPTLSILAQINGWATDQLMGWFIDFIGKKIPGNTYIQLDHALKSVENMNHLLDTLDLQGDDRWVFIVSTLGKCLTIIPINATISRGGVHNL